MFSRDEEAEARFERLSRMTPDGLVFHPRGPAASGYLVDDATVRRIKTYFAYDWLLYATVAVLALVVLPTWLRSHFLLAALAAGFASTVADRLVKLCLLRRSPPASTRWESGEAALGRPPEPSSRLEMSCTLVIASMALVLLVVIAFVSHNIDAWLLAALCAAVVISLAVDLRRARRA